MITELNQETLMVEKINDITQKLKGKKNQDLKTELKAFSEIWPQHASCRLPFDISLAVQAINIEVII